MRVAVVDGGWGGHRLAMASVLGAGIASQGHDVQLVVSGSGHISAEFEVHCASFSSRVVADNASGLAWWLAALNSLECDLAVFPKCDNLVRHSECIELLQRAPFSSSGLLLKVAPGQDVALKGDVAIERDARLRAACEALELGALDQLALLKGYGDRRHHTVPYFNTRPSAIRWVEDPPLLPCAEGSRRPWDIEYALLAGEVSWRKAAGEVCDAWPDVFADTGVGLALVGPIHPSVRDQVARLRATAPGAVFVVDRYVTNDELAAWHRHARLVMATFSDDQYAPSGASAIAFDNGVPVVAHGNKYVNDLVATSGGGVVLDSLTSEGLVRGIADISSLDLSLTGLVGRARETVHDLVNTLLLEGYK